MRSLAAIVLVVVTGATFALEPQNHGLVKTVKIAGDGGWDYLTVDDVNRKVYISHGTQVDVMDADTLKYLATIPETAGVHGIAIANDLNRGFISNGKANSATIFDLRTLKKIDDVKTGRNPDSILYDPSSKKVFTFNGADKNTTVIDAKKGTVVETIDLGGKPEGAVADGKGKVYVNIENTNEIAQIDTKTLKVINRWPLAPGEIPTGLAIDTKNNRLFSACRSKHLVVVDADSGKVVSNLPIGAGTDAAAFDAARSTIYCSCGDGTLTVVKAEGKDSYKIIETIKTKPRSKTMALDPVTHRLYVPMAEFKAPLKPTDRPVMEPGSFGVLIYSR